MPRTEHRCACRNHGTAKIRCRCQPAIARGRNPSQIFRGRTLVDSRIIRQQRPASFRVEATNGRWSIRSKRFNAAQKVQLWAALNYLSEHWEEWADSGRNRVANNCLARDCADTDCAEICNGLPWGGVSSGQPAFLVNQMLNSGRLKIRRANCAALGRLRGCRQIGKPNPTIEICRPYIDLEFSSQERKSRYLAETIVHEVLHALGADEQACRNMTPWNMPATRTWSCNDFS